jgi:hypothetical protein
MADLELLKQLRAAGVKTASFHQGDVVSVEFFPRSLLDVTEFADPADPMNAATDRPPPPEPEDGPPNIPPAMARILSRGSVS